MQASLRLAVLGLLLTLSHAAAAAELTTGAEPVRVTVFNDRARVTAAAEVEVPAGASSVTITGLQAGIYRESLRVTGRATAAVEIGSVEVRKVFSESLVGDEEARLNAEIEALQDQRRVQADLIKAAELQVAFIANLVAGPTAPSPDDEEARRGLDPAAWPAAWTNLRQGAGEAFEAIRNAQLAQRDIDRKLRALNQELAQIRTGSRTTLEARVAISAAAAGRLDLEVTYQVPGAGWWPIYDARLDTESGRLVLVQLAEVVQRTGEDWEGVELTLSTARPSEGTAVPALAPWFIALQPLGQEQMGFGAGAPSAFEDLSQVQSELAKSAPQEGEPEESREEAARRAGAQLIASGFSAQYRIPGRSRVPADNSPHRFLIGSQETGANLLVRTVPKVAPRAYLQAAFSHQGAQPLLPGALALYRDGAFIGNAQLPLLRPKEETVLSFGVDDRVAVDYALADSKRSSAGLLGGKRRIERNYRMTVTNHHERPIVITVFDQLPVSTDEDIEVIPAAAATTPTETDFEDKKGVAAWTYDYGPGEERVIDFGYSVTYPADQSLAGFPAY